MEKRFGNRGMMLACTMMAAAQVAQAATTQEAICWSEGSADAGYSVTIERDEAGRRTLTVSERTIAGPREIGQTRVARVDKRNGQRVYRGIDLRLDVKGRYPTQDRILSRARISGSVFQAGAQAGLVCELSQDEVLPTPGNTSPFMCMAYWEGFVFSAENGQCMSVGGSGCSNPFEFRQQHECEAAFTLRR